MSFEASLEQIKKELSNLRGLFDKEVNTLKQQIGEYSIELDRLRTEHSIEQRNWENSRNVFQQNIVDLENEILSFSNAIPREKEFLECLPHIAFICDIDGVINYSNQALRSFFDLENADIEWFPFGKAAIDSALIRGSWAREIELKSKNGIEITVEAKLFSWNNYSGDISGFIGIAIDKTHLIQLEIEKKKLKQELDSLYMLLPEKTESEKKASRQKELRCVILGDHKSGKSALINGLIGDMLPEGKVINLPIRCGRGAERVIVAHYWNGERQCFFKEDASVERVEKLLSENDLLWLELRSPDAIIPYNILIEEDCAISKNIVSKADAFIYISTIRNYPSSGALNKLQNFLNEGAYGIFAISKTDLERDDYECGEIAMTAAAKIESAIKQTKRILTKYSKLKNCHVLPISSHLRMNLSTIVWHLEEVISSYQAPLNHSPYAAPFSLPEKDSDVAGSLNALNSVIEAFHEQEFQAEFMRFIKSVAGKHEQEKMNCLFISPHRESVNKLIARLAHDISYMHVLDGKEKNWIANFEDIRYEKISFPDSVLNSINFVIAPEAFDMDEDAWKALLSNYVPVIVIELTGSSYCGEELDSITRKTYLTTLKQNKFCIVSGEGLMIDSVEIISKSINEWANHNVPLFIYENYNVIIRSVNQ